MNRRIRYTVLLCLSTGLIAFLLLSLSLSDLQFQSGGPIPGGAEASTAIRVITPELVRAVSLAPILEAILGVALMGLMIYVPVRLMGLINLRRLLAWLIAMVVIVILLSILPALLLQLPASRAIIRSPDLITPSPSASSPVRFGGPPSFLIWIVLGCFILGVGLAVVGLWRGAHRISAAKDALSQTAQDALRDLGTGMDFSNVTIRCYLQMNQVLLSERKLERHHTMTVREFEQWLADQGIPGDPVHQLTSLFEKARYGYQPMNSADEEAGMDCLKQIVHYCQQGRPQGT